MANWGGRECFRNLLQEVDEAELSEGRWVWGVCGGSVGDGRCRDACAWW